MSLLNQVLRDLDHRQAASTPAAAVKPALARSLKPSGSQRALRWGLGVAVTCAAIVAGGWAQGSLKWPSSGAQTSTPQAVAAVVPSPVPPVPSVPSVPPAPPPVPMAAPAPAPAAAVLPPDTALPRAAPATPEPAPTQVAVAATGLRSKPAAPARAKTPASDDAPVTTIATTARIELRTAARSPQERAEAQYQRGVVAHQSGQINDSAAAFTAALREDPRHAGARVAQAGLLIGQARPDEALALLKEGLALSPGQPQLALMLARLHADRQDWATAADTLKAANAQPGDAEFQGFHAAILQRAGRHGEAVEKYGQALRLAPNRGVWWMGLAISLEEIGQADAARTAFQRAKSIGLPDGAAGYVDARLRQLG